MMPKNERVEKYTDEEVTAGKARNAAVRMAVLEHLLKFLGEGCEYEQREVVRAACRLWGSDSPARHDEDGIPVERLLLEFCDDDNQPLSVRGVALQHLPREDREKRELPLMLAIVKSKQTSDSDVHGRVVQDAVAYLKDHAPDTLKGIRTQAYWKQRLINDAAGLPPPPRPKAAEGATQTWDQGLEIK